MVKALLNSSPNLMMAPGYKLNRFSKQVQKILEGSNRKYFILVRISLLIFLYTNNTSFFGFLWFNLRDLFTKTELEDDMIEYIISVYTELNSPLPEELANWFYKNHLLYFNRI